jgi:hypothetical protein
VWLAATGVALGGCATAPAPGFKTFDFFGQVDPASDPWYEVVGEWQERARVQHPGISISGERNSAPVWRSGLLSEKVRAFEKENRLELARLINKWTRLTVRKHYLFDDGTDPDDPSSQDEHNSDPITFENDHWPTYPELIARNGDDCDGLDLVAYQLLHEFGFKRNQIFRAVVMRNRDRANHMVTLWFEDPEDPWVFDATGAMTFKLVRFSEIAGWTPTNVFNESFQYSVLKRGAESLAVVPSSP